MHMCEASSISYIMSTKADIYLLLTRPLQPFACPVVASACRGFVSGLDLASGASIEGLASPFGQAPTCGRSGAAGDANSGRSFCLSPAPARILWARLEPLSARPDPSSSLTPARWQSKSLDGQSRSPNGAGKAVPSGTGSELLWNWHPTEIIAFSVRFQRFRIFPRVHVCACVCANARVYARGSFAGTLELHNNTYEYQLVNSSREVPKRFRLGTAMAARRAICGKPSEINILAVGYSPICADGLSSTVIRGRGRKTFGLGARMADAIASAEGCDLVGSSGSTRRGQNGGFPPFSGSAWARIGKVMLEGWRARRANPPFLRLCRMPLRPTRTPRGATPRGVGSAPRPPLAPIAASSPPSTLAHERAGIWIGMPILDRGPEDGFAGRRQPGRGRIGSGWGFVDRETRTAKAGRGNSGRVRAEPGRLGHGRTGGAGVN